MLVAGHFFVRHMRDHVPLPAALILIAEGLLLVPALEAFGRIFYAWKLAIYSAPTAALIAIFIVKFVAAKNRLATHLKITLFIFSLASFTSLPLIINRQILTSPPYNIDLAVLKSSLAYSKNGSDVYGAGLTFTPELPWSGIFVPSYVAPAPNAGSIVRFSVATGLFGFPVYLRVLEMPGNSIQGTASKLASPDLKR